MREVDVMYVFVTLDEQKESWLIFFWQLYSSYGPCVGRAKERGGWLRSLYKKNKNWRKERMEVNVIFPPPFLDFRCSYVISKMFWEHHAHELASLCCVLSGLAASRCNLTQLTCACGRPASRTRLESWAGVQACKHTVRNYHRAWFSSVTESFWESCFIWWSRPPHGPAVLPPLLMISSLQSRCVCWVAEIRDCSAQLKCEIQQCLCS